jgi:hypothetical protein
MQMFMFTYHTFHHLWISNACFWMGNYLELSWWAMLGNKYYKIYHLQVNQVTLIRVSKPIKQFIFLKTCKLNYLISNKKQTQFFKIWFYVTLEFQQMMYNYTMWNHCWHFAFISHSIHVRFSLYAVFVEEI